MILPILLLAAGAAHYPDCQPAALSLGTDGEGGAFDGMSHSGTLLVIRNMGTTACRVPGLPQLSFLDAQGRALLIARRSPAGMHPGPVVLPVVIAPGAEATAPLRWVSGPVYDKSRCLKPASLRATIAGAAIGVAFGAQICGPAAGVTIEQPPLRIDPVVPG